MNKGKPVNFKPLAWRFEGECIRCTSHFVDPKGYPRFRRYGKPNRPIARYIILKRLGMNLPPSVVSLHSCDNTWCINPAHITAGTQGENMRDMVARGRHRPRIRRRHNETLTQWLDRVTERDLDNQRYVDALWTADLSRKIKKARGQQ